MNAVIGRRSPTWLRALATCVLALFVSSACASDAPGDPQPQTPSEPARSVTADVTPDSAGTTSDQPAPVQDDVATGLIPRFFPPAAELGPGSVARFVAPHRDAGHCRNRYEHHAAFARLQGLPRQHRLARSSSCCGMGTQVAFVPWWSRHGARSHLHLQRNPFARVLGRYGRRI